MLEHLIVRGLHHKGEEEAGWLAEDVVMDSYEEEEAHSEKIEPKKKQRKTTSSEGVEDSAMVTMPAEDVALLLSSVKSAHTAAMRAHGICTTAAAAFEAEGIDFAEVMAKVSASAHDRLRI